MMGFTVPDASVPIVKTTTACWPPARLNYRPAAGAGLHTLRHVCPRPAPGQPVAAAVILVRPAREFDKLEQHNLFDCIERRLLWACPSNIPLVQYYRASRPKYCSCDGNTPSRSRTRMRFEARQARIAQEEAARKPSAPPANWQRSNAPRQLPPAVRVSKTRSRQR